MFTGNACTAERACSACRSLHNRISRMCCEMPSHISIPQEHAVQEPACQMGIHFTVVCLGLLPKPLVRGARGLCVSGYDYTWLGPVPQGLATKNSALVKTWICSTGQGPRNVYILADLDECSYTSHAIKASDLLFSTQGGDMIRFRTQGISCGLRAHRPMSTG